MNISSFSSASRSLSALMIATTTLREDIEQVRSCWFHLLLICTAIVVIGVVVEGVEHLWSPETPNEWHKRLERLGWLLVIVGVLGELVFEATTSKADSMLQDFSNTLLAITTEQAGNAAKSAKTAHEEADRAKASADAAMQTAHVVGEYAAWRTISDKQAASVRHGIQPLKGRTLIYFGNFNDGEILQFANRLIGILDNGIMDAKPGAWQTGMITEPGFKFGYGKDRKKDFNLLVKALDEAGIEKADILRRKSSSKGMPDDWLTITFGAKH